MARAGALTDGPGAIAPGVTGRPAAAVESWRPPTAGRRCQPGTGVSGGLRVGLPSRSITCCAVSGPLPGGDRGRKAALSFNLLRGAGPIGRWQAGAAGAGSRAPQPTAAAAHARRPFRPGTLAEPPGRPSARNSRDRRSRVELAALAPGDRSLAGLKLLISGVIRGHVKSVPLPIIIWAAGCDSTAPGRSHPATPRQT